MNRLLGIKEGDSNSVLMILVGALHGNESTGVTAIINVFRTLEEKDININGKIVGLLGNTKAYELNKRFIDYDLNRCWYDDKVQQLRTFHNPLEEKAEDSELLELLGEINNHTDSKYKTKILVDLHATSSENGNFIVIPEDESDNTVVKTLRLPIVINLEKYLAGTLLEYMHRRGFVSFAFEGGLIGSDMALTMHTSGIWELMFASGIVDRDHLHDSEFDKYEDVIESFIHELPHKLCILYRHEVKNGDGFKMRPGYLNFQKVSEGEILADDNNGPISVRKNGLVFMPLYQEKGKDGFFIVKEIEGRI